MIRVRVEDEHRQRRTGQQTFEQHPGRVGLARSGLSAHEGVTRSPSTADVRGARRIRGGGRFRWLPTCRGVHRSPWPLLDVSRVEPTPPRTVRPPRRGRIPHRSTGRARPPRRRRRGAARSGSSPAGRRRSSPPARRSRSGAYSFVDVERQDVDHDVIGVCAAFDDAEAPDPQPEREGTADLDRSAVRGVRHRRHGESSLDVMSKRNTLVDARGGVRFAHLATVLRQRGPRRFTPRRSGRRGAPAKNRRVNVVVIGTL